MGILIPFQGATAQTTPAIEDAPAATEAVVRIADPLVSEAISRRFSKNTDVVAFYTERSFAPIWLDAGGLNAMGTELLAVLAEAPRHALPVSRYRIAELNDQALRVATLTPTERAGFEAELTAAFLAYARDVSSGILEPRKVDRELYVYPVRKPAGVLLEMLTSTDEPVAFFESLPPQTEDYTRLVERYRAFRAFAETGEWGPILRKKRTLRPGERSKHVVALRDRLTAMGFLAEPVAEATDGVVLAVADTVNDSGTPAITSDPYIYDEMLVEAVRLFQQRHGLNQDGAVGPATRAALNIEPGFRAAQIAVNLERMRWLNKDLGHKHIMVNLAGFDMAVMEGGVPVFESRVVVGKSRKHRTPEFSDEMEHMVVNPTWHVPRSIANKEILPALQQDPDYLRRKGMRISGVDDPSLIDWSTITPATFPGRVKQRPGGGNALGRVKFMFPNDHAIYLHDTPSKSLFNRDTRAYSHGCVRVQKPFEFAEFLLSAQESDPKGKFDRLLRTGKERYVNFDQHIPVHLTYRTAWIDDQGVDQFRGDIYGRDRKVLAALEKTGVDLPEH